MERKRAQHLGRQYFLYRFLGLSSVKTVVYHARSMDDIGDRAMFGAHADDEGTHGSRIGDVNGLVGTDNTTPSESAGELFNVRRRIAPSEQD